MEHPDTSGNQDCKSLTSKYAIKKSLKSAFTERICEIRVLMFLLTYKFKH